MLGLPFSAKLDWGSEIISVAKIGALTRCMKFLSPEFALFLYKSVIQLCMKYCCHSWAGTPSCYLKLLDKLQKRIYRTLGSLSKCRQFESSVGITLLGVNLNWLNWLLFLILEGGLLVILIYCMFFLSSFLHNTKMSMSSVSFVAQLDPGISVDRILCAFFSLYLHALQWLFSLAWSGF